MPWPNSWSIVSIHRSFGSTLQSTRTSPSRSMSMQNACWLLPSRAVEVAALEDGAHVEPEAVVGADGERLEIAIREQRIEVDRAARSADPGRTARRSATAAARRPSSRSARASAASSSAFHAANGAAVSAVDLVEGREEPVLVHLAGRQREREVVAVPERAGRPRCAGGRAPAPDRRPRRRSASTPPRRAGGGRCRRSCAGSRGSRCRRRARPSSSPRKVLYVDSTSSRARRDVDGGRRGPGAGANASWSTSSWRRTERVEPVRRAGVTDGARTCRRRTAPPGARDRRPCGAARPRVRRRCSRPTRRARARSRAAAPLLEIDHQAVGLTHRVSVRAQPRGDPGSSARPTFGTAIRTRRARSRRVER